MITIGIRCSTTEIRFAIIDTDKMIMLNTYEHRIKMAKNLENSDLFQWVYKEIDEIIKNNKTIQKAFICENSYTKDSKSLRLSNRLDAIISLALKDNGIPSEIKCLQYKEVDIMSMAEKKIGKTDSNWNKLIACCIVIALRGAQ